MKKSLCFAFMFVFMVAVSAQAVVVHWAVTYPDWVADGVTSAQLVYSAVGGPGAGTIPVENVLAAEFTPLGLGEQNTVHTPNPSSGNYFIVLFNDSGEWTRSIDALAWNADAVSIDEFTPGTSTFDPGAGSGFMDWMPVPEPGSAAVMAIGLGLLALRRRKRS